MHAEMILNVIMACFLYSQIKRLVPEFAPTGLYTFRQFIGQPIEPFSSTVTYSTLTAYCNMETDGGGWMIIQRRLPNGTVNFTRNWNAYENGFGDLEGEFWYGLRNIHYLTTRDQVELRIDMVKKTDGEAFSWTYQTFSVGGAADKYRLTVGEGEGEGFDAMSYHDGQQFITHDDDNDAYSTNCAYIEQGGWWYKDCYRSNLNGPHTQPDLPGLDEDHAILEWYDGAHFLPLSSIVMKIRVKRCKPAVEACSE